MAGPAILCVGRTYCDLIFSDLPRMPSMGTEVFAPGLSVHAGGGAAITAAGLAQAGRVAYLASHLPAAPFGPGIRAQLAEAGIELSLVKPPPPGTDPQITVALSGPGDRAFLSRRDGPSAPQLSTAELAGLGISHIHVGELATLLEMPRLILLARNLGASISLDCGWDDTVELDAARPLISAVDVFLPNSAEYTQLLANGLPDPMNPLTIVKEGADGATARCVSSGICHAATTPIAAVDTTGAGDAFNAGFLDAWLTGRDLPASLAAGNAAGARAICHIGGIPTRPPPKHAPALAEP